MKIICDGIDLAYYNKLSRCGYSNNSNLENAKAELLKIFEALKNHEKTYEIGKN